MSIQNRYLDGSEIIAKSVSIRLSSSAGGGTINAQIVGKSPIYGHFAITKFEVRFVHRKNGKNPVTDFTWY